VRSASATRTFDSFAPFLSVIKKLKANSYRLKAFVYKGLIIELRLLCCRD
jgi:hypothetical protein